MNNLKELAALYRENLERVLANTPDKGIELRSFPGGACEISSIMLGHFLHGVGFKGVELVNASRRYRDYAYETESYSQEGHVWLIINSEIIVDITADQFDDFDEPVCVVKKSDFHSKFTENFRKDVKDELLTYPYGNIFKEVKCQIANT